MKSIKLFFCVWDKQFKKWQIYFSSKVQEKYQHFLELITCGAWYGHDNQSAPFYAIWSGNMDDLQT